LARARSSVEIVVGERDDRFVEVGRELATIIPRASLTIASGAGHNLLLERPSLVAELLQRGTSP
jgi:2-succinyl-6-hydroxy-2,4-cyclohexadiene-1-carboxylate synthase